MAEDMDKLLEEMRIHADNNIRAIRNDGLIGYDISVTIFGAEFGTFFGLIAGGIASLVTGNMDYLFLVPAVTSFAGGMAGFYTSDWIYEYDLVRAREERRQLDFFVSPT